jgi:NAD(P)H-dependent FMN reductase
MLPKIAILVGSLRMNSLTKKMAKAFAMLSSEHLACSLIEIGDLPLYNEDLDEKPPTSWVRFRSEIKHHDAVLFFTPEYNRSIPGCLKNAVDVGSRPRGKSVFNGLAAGVVSVTPHKLGAFGANHALRQTLVFLNMPVMQQPEAYIADAGSLFDGEGELQNDETRAFLAKYATAFAHWVETIAGASKRDAFTPSGGSVQGAKEVSLRYDADAKSFTPGGSSSFDVLQSGADGDIGYWTGFQNADACMGNGLKKVHMKLRVTELFRFQEGGWKLIHRHADSAADRPH